MAKHPPNHLIPSDLCLSDDLLIRGAEQFGTPMYVYDQRKLQRNWSLLLNHLPGPIDVHYSVKANPSLAIVHTFAQLGASFEVTSLGELLTVLRAGVAPERIIFVGPGKTDSELSHAVEQGLRALIVESPREVFVVQSLAHNLGKRARIALRINPGVGKGMLSMGGATQFGMDLEAAFAILHATAELVNVDVVGIQGYLGTQILDWRVILDHFRIILQISDELQQKSGTLFSFIDLGGGFGVPYYAADQALDLSALRASLSTLVDQYRRNNPAVSMIAVESGRFLVGSAGVFVARVVDIKRLHEQHFVILDGGINVYGGLDRYAGSRPTPVRVLGGDEDSVEALTLCGPLCTPLDRVAASVLLPMPRVGELLVFYVAGAYGYSASPGLFLSHGFPCELLATGGQLALIRRRSTTEDLLSSQYLI